MFFSVIPISVGLVLANLPANAMRQGAFASASRTILFLPQIVPLVAAGIAWSWMCMRSPARSTLSSSRSDSDSLSRSWLADFATALPAVGLIGSWVLTGLCTVLLLTGMGKIDGSLYEAVRLDGAGWFRGSSSRSPCRVCGRRSRCSPTITVIAALSTFDIIYTTTKGGPGTTTLVPGISIFAWRSSRARSVWRRHSASSSSSSSSSSSCPCSA